ncbi:MAG TPA: hypothetical protein DCR40_19145 [Prolixibacteraceae bacterium]|nr:hypothetical protein [Prolixibacteraceae bacterium]
MKQKKNNKELLYNIGFIKRTFAPIYYSTGGRYTNGNFPLINKTIIENKPKSVFCIFDVPDYHDFKCKAHFNVLQSKQYNGSFLQLLKYKSVDDFIEKTFRPKKRTEFKKFIRKLNVTITPEFKVIIGPETELKEIDNALSALFNLIYLRFKGKGIYNRFTEIENQNKLRTELEILIIQNKASIAYLKIASHYISVSVQYHQNDIVLYSIPSFDDSFSKYNLGHIHLYYLINYCFEKGFSKFDFSKGDGIYKSKWTTSEYNYFHYFLYPKNSFFLKYIACYFKLKYDLIQYFREKDYNTIYKKLTYSFKYLWGSWKLHKQDISSTMLISDSITDKIFSLSPYFKSKFFNFIYDKEFHINDIESITTYGNKINLIINENVIDCV